MTLNDAVHAAPTGVSMNKDAIKGLLIVLAVALALALGAVMLTDDGWRKLGCVFRAVAQGVAISNIRSLCY